MGFTENLKARLKAHNHGQSSRTDKFKPWELITYLAYEDTLILLSDMVYLDHIGAALFEPRADRQDNEITLLNKTFIEK